MPIYRERISGFFCYLLRGFIVLFVFAAEARAQGSLLLYPRRLVFEGTERVHEINIANNGKDTAKYAISLQAMQMSETGDLKPQSGDSSNELLSRIKYYPKHIFLAPGEAQVVKVQLAHRGGSKLATGEYRCHLQFKPIPRSTMGKAKMKKMVTRIKLRLSPVFSFTVPVIVRVGESTTRADIQDITFIPGDTATQLKLTVNRTGNMSLHGDLYVFFETADGNQKPVGTIRGFSVYAPYEKRQFSIKLPKNTSYQQGTFRVICYTQVEERLVKIAENTLKMP